MNNYRWLNEASLTFLKRDYLLPNQTVDERVDIIVNKTEKILKKKGFAKKLKENIQKGWYSLSTPIWTNFGTERGSPISCFNTHIDDSVESILYGAAEVGTMSKIGGGTSGYFGDVRHRGAPISVGGTSYGSVYFMKLFEETTKIISQSNTRRGSFAAYQDIEHKDILEFLDIRSEGNPLQDINTGVCVTDKFMQEMIAGDREKRKIWAKVIKSRSETGFPYIFFTDTVNNNTVDVYKDKGLKINSSNLCTEILQPSNSKESFVCDLSSMNLLYWEEWKDTDAVEILTYFLDAVLTEFIEKNKNKLFMERAVRHAERHRAIGIGALGWHSLLQSKLIPFESFEAKILNAQIFKYIQDESYKASAKLAKEYGEPELLKGYGRRNAVTGAIAPTTSSAFIMAQVSQEVEPYLSNYYIKDLAKTNFSFKNPYLQKILQELNKDTTEVWNSILKKAGSVQHLDFLDDNLKKVFKTFNEISPFEIITQAAQRQKFIDQGQSLNLMIHPSTSTKEINQLLIKAWEMGIKTLYYQINLNAAQEFSREILTCSSCES